VLVAATIICLGLVMGIAVIQVTDLRLSGVLVVPLVALYTLYSVETLPLFVLSAIVAYAGIAITTRRTLVFGRKLLLVAMASGAVCSLALTTVLAHTIGVQTNASGVLFVGSILPGIAAYNYHRLDADRQLDDLLLTGSALVGLVGLGVGLVNPTIARMIGNSTPVVLFSPHSDVAAFNDAVVFSTGHETALSYTLAVIVVFGGFILAESAYNRWDVRLNGTVILPLLALFTVQFPEVLFYYVLGLGTVYGAISVINWTTLLYGRVLLTTAVLVGTVLTIPIGFATQLPGFVLLFTGIFAGVAAYNLHRVAPRKRPTAILLSGGLFTGLLGVTWVFTLPAPAAIIDDIDPAVAAVGVGMIAIAGMVATRLERRQRLIGVS